MVVAAAEEEEEERRSFVAVAGSRWFGWEVVASRVGSESMVVAVAARNHGTDVSFTYSHRLEVERGRHT